MSYTTFVEFRVRKFSDISEKLIPFFIKYPIEGMKFLDFKDFCATAAILKRKEHLTPEGLIKIREIKKGINRGRY